MGIGCVGAWLGKRRDLCLSRFLANNKVVGAQQCPSRPAGTETFCLQLLASLSHVFTLTLGGISQAQTLLFSVSSSSILLKGLNTVSALAQANLSAALPGLE